MESSSNSNNGGVNDNKDDSFHIDMVESVPGGAQAGHNENNLHQLIEELQAPTVTHPAETYHSQPGGFGVSGPSAFRKEKVFPDDSSGDEENNSD